MYSPKNSKEKFILKQIATKTDHDLLGFDAEQVWDTELAFKHLKSLSQVGTRRTAERRLNTLKLLPKQLSRDDLRDENDLSPNCLVLNWAIERAGKRRDRVLFAQFHSLPNGKPCLHANDARGARFWVPIACAGAGAARQALVALQQRIGKHIVLFPHGALLAALRGAPSTPEIQVCFEAYLSVFASSVRLKSTLRPSIGPYHHLKRLEAESIHIIREAATQAQNPVMMYSIGKDSGVMLHLARKAFYPALPPFPLLHIDMRWKLREIHLFRDFMARESCLDLLIHTNSEDIEKNINPFEHGSAMHSDITKTDGFKHALDHYKFDLVLVGARRDEEKSRANEPIFSFHSDIHRWDTKSHCLELWNLYNTQKNPGEGISVLPLSNWTELDIWQYIYQEDIPMVPLYFAKPRPVVVRGDRIMMVDHERCGLLPGEEIQIKKVRCRTLSCYPLTAAVESDAESPEEVLLELINSRLSERNGRKIDTATVGCMVEKKQEGYF